ncbi:MAG: hypothetical protein AAGA62_14995, partial [Bacteroidota bacterium]
MRVADNRHIALGKKRWFWIINREVTNIHLEDDMITRGYNVMAILSLLATLTVTLSAWWFNYPQVYILSSIGIASLYLGIWILNWAGHTDFARYYTLIGTALWVSWHTVLCGGYFGQGAAILASLGITFISFPKHYLVRTALIVFVPTVYFLSTIYVRQNGPIYGLIEFPYDELVVFGGATGWVIVLIHKINKARQQWRQRMQVKNERLKTITEELERFTYIASHDLKSPVRTISSFATLLERDLEAGNCESARENLD